jgi:hypothetical protein
MRSIRGWLMTLIDPAGAYMAEADFDEDVDLPPRAPKPDSWASIRDPDEWERLRGARCDWLVEHHHQRIESSVDQLVRSGEVVVGTTHGSLAYRLRRFRNASVLEQAEVAADGTWVVHGQAMINRNSNRDSLIRYVTWDIASMGPTAEPLDLRGDGDP